MPNGRPGDNPYTDIVVHKRTFYGTPIDELLRKLDATKGFGPYRDEVFRLVWDGAVESDPTTVDDIERRLREIEAELAELS